MMQISTSIRADLSPKGQQLFDDVASQRVLGASTHIKLIAQMFRDLCKNAEEENSSSARLNTRIHELADFFIKTRGEASQAITNAIVLMLKGSNQQSGDDLNSYIDFIQRNIESFEKQNQHNLDLINQYAQSILSRMNAVLLFDYSSTVGRMVETCDHPLDVYIAESRALNGGKPYVLPSLKGHHEVHFIPDAAIYHYLKCCDGVFIGSETYYADGRVFNTVGTEMVAAVCDLLHVPFYVLTTLLKVDMRSIYGYSKPPVMLNLREKILLDLDQQLKNQVDYSCPELVEIPSKLITGFITEEGIVPPTAMFQLSIDYTKKIEDVAKNA